MNLNKNISVWRGNNTPPSQYHLWQKGDVLLHHNGLEWVENKVPMASPSQNGLMSKEDKDKLDELADEQVVADEEDITSVNGQLKLKDRDNTNGMGYVILRKNKSFAEQVTKANTIYEIRYEFNLESVEVKIPESCILKFEGGKIINGTIKANRLSIQSENVCFASDVIIKGNILGPFHSKWWIDTTKDVSTVINTVLHNCIKTDRVLGNNTGYDDSECFVFDNGEYKVNKTIDLSRIKISIDGDNSIFKPTDNFIGDYVFNTLDAGYDDNIDFAKGFCGSFIKNLKIDGRNSNCGGLRLFWSFKQTLETIMMYNMYNTGVHIGDHCAETYCNDITVIRRIIEVDGDYVGFLSETSDSVFNEIVPVHYPIGIKIIGDSVILTNSHPWGYCKSQYMKTTTMKIGILFKDTSCISLNNVVDTYEAIDNTKLPEEIINGQLNGGCGIYLDGMHNTTVDGVVPVVPDNNSKASTIYIKSSWHVAFRNVKASKSGIAIQYSPNRAQPNNDSMYNVGSDVNKSILYGKFEEITDMAKSSDRKDAQDDGEMYKKILSRNGNKRLQLTNYINGDANITSLISFLIDGSLFYITLRNNELYTYHPTLKLKIGSVSSPLEWLSANALIVPTGIDISNIPTALKQNAVVIKDKDRTRLLLVNEKGQVCNLDGSSIKNSGTTAERPTDVTIGFQYFDMSLPIPRPIWWSGSKWVDATGTNV